jgi:hypothetical protein
VENVWFHVNVRDKTSDFVPLLNYLMKCRGTIFAATPVDNNFHSVTLAPAKKGLRVDNIKVAATA